MKKLWIPLAIAVLLLPGCIPRPDASATSQPAAQATPEITLNATVSPTSAVSAPAATVTASAISAVPSYWPPQIPANIPVFNYGQHVQTTVYGGEVTIVFSGVSKEDYGQYRDTLDNAGFFLAHENIEPVGVSEFTMNGSNCVLTLRVTKDDHAELKYTPAG